MSLIGSQWIESWVTFLNGSRPLRKRFAPVNSPNFIGKEHLLRSSLSGAQSKPDRQIFRWKIFPSIIFRTQTAWNSKSERNSFLPGSKISGQVPVTSATKGAFAKQPISGRYLRK